MWLLSCTVEKKLELVRENGEGGPIREGDEAITATAPHTTYTLTMNTLDYVVQSWHLSQKLFHKEQNFKFSIE